MKHRAWVVPARVLGVIDGDTVRVELDLGWDTYRVEDVRLSGIDAPEKSTSAGMAAFSYVLLLLPPGSQVTVESQSYEKYGRTLGAIKLADGRDLAAEMLQAGHAVPYGGGPRRPTPP